MRILTRYLLRAHAAPFLFALTVLTALLLINTVAQRFEELAGKGLESSVIAEVFLLSVPYTLALTLPMAVLVAVLFAFGQLTADNEITAMKASGVHLARLLVPLLVAAAMLAGGMVWFHDTLLPAANHRLAGLLHDIARKSPTLELEEQVINAIDT
ncbi:MAG: LptF/LptG family permease, partial [Gemmatimonadota bacterium]